MAIDSMNKAIHAAFRRDLQRLEDALGSVPDGDKERAADLSRAWEHLAHQLHRHHGHEDEHFHPALRSVGVDGSLLDAMDAEHAAMSAAVGGVGDAMATYAVSASAADAAAAKRAVERGRAVVVDHLDHEEAELEPLIKPHLDSAEWKQAEKQVRKQSPGELGQLFAWLQDGGDPEAHAYLRDTMPGPVLKVAGVLGRGYRRKIAPVWR
jgi:hemerythrin-like domain-containing protein